MAELLDRHGWVTGGDWSSAQNAVGPKVLRRELETQREMV
jgi:hypothetical protein